MRRTPFYGFIRYARIGENRPVVALCWSWTVGLAWSWPMGLAWSWPMGLAWSWTVGLAWSWTVGLAWSWPMGLAWRPDASRKIRLPPINEIEQRYIPPRDVACGALSGGGPVPPALLPWGQRQIYGLSEYRGKVSAVP